MKRKQLYYNQRRGPDTVREEIMRVLSAQSGLCGFNDLFEKVLAGLKQRGPVNSGEEMLRLRIYEKLQLLASQGLVDKVGKEYGPTSELCRQVEAAATTTEA